MGESVSVSRLSAAYIRFAESYYVKDGKITSHISRVRSALRTLVAEFGNVKADRFLPLHLEKLQQKYLKLGLSRHTINMYTNIVRQAFRYGVTKGKVPASIWQSLLAVRHLQRGRTTAKESEQIKPVHPFDVIKTIRELGPVVSRMVRLQYVTGMRPGEVC